jgi:hypothetical protein
MMAKLIGTNLAFTITIALLVEFRMINNYDNSLTFWEESAVVLLVYLTFSVTGNWKSLVGQI